MTSPSTTTPAETVLYEERPWGAFWVLEDCDTHKVKRLMVKPGQRLSLQMHHKREEYWLVIRGLATVTVGEKTWDAPVGETIHIPTEAKHRLSNQGSQPVEIVEVQLGNYFGEDDIVRFEDDYKRI